MAEPNANIVFSDIRKCYRNYFFALLEEKNLLLCDPETLEFELAENQRSFFLPLVDEKARARLLEFDDKDSDLESHLNHLAKSLEKKAGPRLVGCHYRAVGLPRLRVSRFHLLENYEKVATQFVNDELGSSVAPQETDWPEHPERIFFLYGELFGIQSTVNQQVFNTNLPPGPIGFIFYDLYNARRNSPGEVPGSVLDLRNLLTAEWLEPGSFRPLCSVLAEAVRMELKERASIAEYLLLSRAPRPSKEELNDARARLENGRDSLERTLEKILDEAESPRAQWATVKGFFRHRFPANESLTKTRYILTFLQCYYLYEPAAGPCLYTFPAMVRPDLPTCGWTLTCEQPLRSSVLEILQRLSETVYGELFGVAVSRRYKQSMAASITVLRRRDNNPLPRLFDPGVDLLLGAALAETPIPLDGAINFLSFVAETAKSTVYEGRRYGFLMALSHQEFLERFVDRIISESPEDREPARDAARRPREPDEAFSSDPVSLALAAAGMRIHAKERSCSGRTGRLLFFVYPPFGPTIVELESRFPTLVKRRGEDYFHEMLRDRETIKELLDKPDDEVAEAERKLLRDIYDRRALVLDKGLGLDELARSKELIESYKKVSYSKLTADPEAIAIALTYGNPEVLIAHCDDESGRLRLYHDGTVILESTSTRWELPERSGDFANGLKARCRMFLGHITDDNRVGILREVESALTRFLQEQSRTHHGAFLVFHPEDKPSSWVDLDPVPNGPSSTESTSSGRSWSLDDACRSEWGREHLLPALREFSEVDGAIVLSLERAGPDSGYRILLSPRTQITIAPLLDTAEDLVEGERSRLRANRQVPGRKGDGKVGLRLRMVKAMKGLQAKHDYPKLRAVGTKHTAAYEYAMLSESGFAVVVSEDGPVSLFYCETFEACDLAKHYHGAEELNAKAGVLKGWKRRVMMLGM